MTVLKIDVSKRTNGMQTEEEVLRGIDFSDWNFSPETNEELQTVLQAVIRSEMAEAIRNTYAWDRPEIEFVEDGENIYVTMNLGSSWNDGHIWWTASIKEMIDEYILHTGPDSMDFGDEAKTTLAKTLRDCASKLEAAVGKRDDGAGVT